MNRVDINAAGDGVNTLAFGYFLAFTSYRPTLQVSSKATGLATYLGVSAGVVAGVGIYINMVLLTP